MSRGAKTSSLRIQWVRSAIGYSSQQGKVIQGLGFRKLRQVVERPDTPQIRGMITKVGHLVEIVPPAAADPFSSSAGIHCSPSREVSNQSRRQTAG